MKSVLGVARVALAVGMLLALAAETARAHYDDAHYALTYYVARRVGYTPTQAHRIASADLSVDYSTNTEPVQGFNTLIRILTAPGVRIEPIINWYTASGEQEPRWRFHAMRNEVRVSPVRLIGVHDASTLQNNVNLQRLALFRDAVEHRNPGVLMHFVQDEVPHYGYGTNWGHWDPTQLTYKGSPHGGTTDWISHRDLSAARFLYEETYNKLDVYMQQASNGQQRPEPMEIDASATKLLEDLIRVNAPAPGSLVAEGRYDAVGFMVYKAGAWDRLRAATLGVNKIYRQLVPAPKVGPSNTITLPTIAPVAELGPPPADFPLHRDGPNLRHAIGVVNEALERDGMEELAKKGGSMPTEHLSYTIEAGLGQDGGHFDAGNRDEWVVFGDLTLELEYGPNARQGDTEITIWQEPTQRGKKRTMLIDPPRKILGWAPQVTFERLPIGKLEIEWRLADGTSVRRHVMLARESTKLRFSSRTGPSGVVEYQGWAGHGTRLWEPGESFVGHHETNTNIKSSSYVKIDFDTGKVTGLIQYSNKYQPKMAGLGPSTTEQVYNLTGKVVVPDWSKLPDPAYGELVIRGTFELTENNEKSKGPFIGVLFKGKDVDLPHYEKFQKHFLVIYNTDKWHSSHAEFTLKKVEPSATAPPNTKPIGPGTRAVLLPVEP